MGHLTLPEYVDSPMHEAAVAERLDSDEATSTVFATPALMLANSPMSTAKFTAPCATATPSAPPSS